MKGNHRWGGVGKAAGAFAVGATAGSLLALLFAPVSGPAMRRRIGMKCRAWERRATRRLRQTQRVLAHRVGDWRESAIERLDHTRQWLAQRAGNGAAKRAVHHRAAA